MNPIRVKDLILELQQCEPEAVVLYAYDKYGGTGVHHFISNDYMVALDSDNQFVTIKNDIVDFLKEDMNDLNDGYQEIVDKYNNVQPAIKLFAR